GTQQERRRQRHADCLGNRSIDDQFKFGRLLNWQIARFTALQDTIHIIRRAAKIVGDIGTVEDHPASIGIDAVRIDGRQPRRCDQQDNKLVLVEEEGIPKDHQRGSAALPQLVERRANRIAPFRLGCLYIDAEGGSGVFECGQLQFVARIARVPQPSSSHHVGNRLFNRPRRLVWSSSDSDASPVMLPAGRARLLTRPASTGSATTPMTIGMLDVACLAARAAAVASTSMTSTGSRTNSAASSGSRSASLAAERNSRIRLCPSTYPSRRIS